jgi:Reverse transcriptase (RNA-dependent DNA polymerase)
MLYLVVLACLILATPLISYMRATEPDYQYIPKSQRPSMHRYRQRLKRRYRQVISWATASSLQASCTRVRHHVHQWAVRYQHHCHLQQLRSAIRLSLGPTASEVPVSAHWLLRPLVCHQAVSMAAHMDDSKGAQAQVFDTDSRLVGIDNRASACMSDDIRDFVGPLSNTDRVVKGFAGSRTTNVQMGTIEWQIEDDSGKITTHRIPNSYYVPDGKVRLLSPQHWARTLPKARRPLPSTPPETTHHDRVELHWDAGRSTKTVWLDPITNVATFPLAPDYKRYHAFCLQASVDDNNDELHPLCYPDASIAALAAQILPRDPFEDESDPEGDRPAPRQTTFSLDGPAGGLSHSNQPIVIEDEEDRRELDNISAEFLRYHHKFNHASPLRIQELARQGVIPRRLASCPVPKCTACLFGKATRRKWRHKNENNSSDSYVPSKPGEVVSVDQMVSPTPGLVAQLSGRCTSARYRYATIFVDQVSELSYMYLQKTPDGAETLEAKQAFERYAMDHGVRIQHYHCDNGIFSGNVWRDACHIRGQGISFSGVNAHHQNGRAERRIRELQQTARTMLIHAQRRWPTTITAHLWPYAMRMANDSYNSLPSLKRKDGRSPLSVFAGVKVQINQRHWHHFGCPVYVLDDHLQKGQRINKWKSRARVGVYLGRLAQHAQSVALVLSLQSGLVSPQFHVAFDSAFHTMRQEMGDDLPPSLWQQKTGFVDPEGQPSVDTESLPTASGGTLDESDPAPDASPITSEGDAHAPTLTLRPAATMETPDRSLQPPAGHDDTSDGQAETGTVSEHTHMGDAALPTAPAADAGAHATERPQRQRRPVQRFIEMMAAVCFVAQAVASTIQVSGEIFCLQAMFPDDGPDDLVAHPLLAFGATADPDTLYYHEAMKAPDKEHFIQAMHEEVSGQLKNKVYSIVPRSKVPQDMRVLPAVWAMRRKRRSKTNEIYRWKSRLNIGGHKQLAGIDYDQTYAPVVTWPAIRLLLALVMVNKWHTRMIDYVQAYPQAPVERPMFMEVPPGFVVPNARPGEQYVLEVHRNIYGQKQAGRVWNKYLVQRLLSIGFLQSQHDECVFYKGRAMYILYTDDSILAGPCNKELDQIIAEMQSTGLDLTVEGELGDFLGINIEARTDGSFELTQTRLIDSILQDLGLEKDNVAIKSTPCATTKLLSQHPGSPPFDNHFHYRSVIGKLNYLEKCTRPDIAYAVHQCARFSEKPTYIHGQAVKWLGRYLRGTRSKGMIIRPTNELLNLYADSDWSGSWDRSIAATDASTARSRHGYVLQFCGVPIFWASQLQTEIALSSTEAEYIGLSRGLRETIPIINILKEMRKLGYPIATHKAKVHCRVFEDNTGALEMATVHKMRPRTKHLNIKYHHFRSHVDNGTITVHKIDTKENISDMLTKGQPLDLLRKHRLLLLGWDVDTEKGCSNTSVGTVPPSAYNKDKDSSHSSDNGVLKLGTAKPPEDSDTPGAAIAAVSTSDNLNPTFSLDRAKARPSYTATAAPTG